MNDLYYLKFLHEKYDIDLYALLANIIDPTEEYIFFSRYYKGVWCYSLDNLKITLKLFYKNIFNSLFFKNFRGFSIPYRFKLLINWYSISLDGIAVVTNGDTFGLSLIDENNSHRIFSVFPVNPIEGNRKSKSTERYLKLMIDSSSDKYNINMDSLFANIKLRDILNNGIILKSRE